MNHFASSEWSQYLPRQADNAALRAWMLDRGSLTARIESHGHFALRVVRQGLATPEPSETRALCLHPGVLVWRREVLLSCDQQVVVFAHTVIPRRPRGPLTVWLARLGDRSLGALLFSHAGFVRGPIEYRRLDRRAALYAVARTALQLPGGRVRSLWARRSHFTLGPQSVLVTEVFSPRLALVRCVNDGDSCRCPQGRNPDGATVCSLSPSPELR